jgi:hypothetical protein
VSIDQHFKPHPPSLFWPQRFPDIRLEIPCSDLAGIERKGLTGRYFGRFSAFSMSEIANDSLLLN